MVSAAHVSAAHVSPHISAVSEHVTASSSHVSETTHPSESIPSRPAVVYPRTYWVSRYNNSHSDPDGCLKFLATTEPVALNAGQQAAYDECLKAHDKTDVSADVGIAVLLSVAFLAGWVFIARA